MNTYDVISDTIYVYASTGCGDSDSTAVYISNSEGGMEIVPNTTFTTILGYPVYQLTNAPTDYTVDASLLDNGELSSIDITSIGSGYYELNTTGTTDLVAETSGWLLVFDVTSGDCTTRIVYGDTDYYTYEEIDNILSSSVSVESSSLKSISLNSSNSTDDSTNSIIAYPNPVSNKLTLELENKSDNLKNYLVYNIRGDLIYNEECKSNKIKINTQSWTGGTYIVSVKTNDKVYNSTVIKQ